jgi:phosphatidylinositol-bisphosphatase
MVILLSKRQKQLGFEVRKLKLAILIDEAGHCSCACYRFQEVVPLNAINVLWVEDETPKAMWEDLIHRTLNNQMGVSKAEESLKSYRSPPSAWHTNALYEGISSVNSLLNTSPDECLGSSLCNSEDGVQGQTYYGTGKQYFKEENHGTVHKWSPMEHVQTAAEDWLAEAAMLDDNFTDDYALMAPVSSRNSTPSWQGSQHYYSCVASKQMVGIFITIWVRSDLRQHVHNVKVCSVGCGIFNFLGNKVKHFIPFY